MIELLLEAKTANEATPENCLAADPSEFAANENTNDLLRQYFPKEMDFDKITSYHLKKVEAELNTRPRKTPGYRTPQKVMME